MPNFSMEDKHFELLREYIGYDKFENIEKSESPDFLFDYNGRRIGVEHTELFLDKEYPLQAKESVEDDIAKLAEEYSNQKGYFPSRTKILFGDIKGLNKSQRKEVAQNLSDYVQFERLASSKEAFHQMELHPRARQVNTIYSTLMPKDLENHYFAVRAGWVKINATKEAADALVRKSKKISAYRKKCNEVWLLVVADGRNPSSLLGKNEGVDPLATLHGFDRAFFMFHIDQYVQELHKLQASEIS